jgi:hypothetical protein
MSRSTQMQYVLSRPSTRPQMTRKEFLVKVQREMKRRMIADGVIEDPRTKRPKFDWHWSIGETTGGIVQANTRGEARAQIKHRLKLHRLPVGITIIKIAPNANSPAITLPNAGVAA